MLLSSAPGQLVEPWAAGGDKNSIPVPSSGTPGAASWTIGFPPLTSVDPLSGGVPPDRLDMNGGLFGMSAIDVWMSAGGGFPYSSGFSTAIGGYPKGARVLRATGFGYWLSTIDNNTTDPDTGGAGWIPDRAVSSVYANAQQTVATGSNKVLWNTVDFDSLGQWDATDKRFVAKWAGIYRFNGCAYFPAPAPQRLSLIAFKNGSNYRAGSILLVQSDGDGILNFDMALNLSATDFIELHLEADGGTGTLVGQSGDNLGLVYGQFEYLGNG